MPWRHRDCRISHSKGSKVEGDGVTKGSSKLTQRFIEFDRISAEAAAEGWADGRLLTLISTSMEKFGGVLGRRT